MHTEQEGRYWKVRVGDRSTLLSKYTSKVEAERALALYKQEVVLAQEKRALRKTRSDKGISKKDS